jgi:hypothetical protein
MHGAMASAAEGPDVGIELGSDALVVEVMHFRRPLRPALLAESARAS